MEELKQMLSEKIAMTEDEQNEVVRVVAKWILKKIGEPTEKGTDEEKDSEQKKE